MNPSRSLVGAEFSRKSPQGGEFEVAENPPDLKRSDSPYRFAIGDMRAYRTSSGKEREATPAVLRHDVAPRREDKGNFNFEQQTRETIDQMRRKSHCTSRHSILHHESPVADNLANSRSLCEARKPKKVRFADDIGYNLEIKPTSRQDYEMITNPENWPVFENEADSKGPEFFCTYFGNRDNTKSAISSYNYTSTVPLPSVRMNDNSQGLDRNQNYHDLLTSVSFNHLSPSQLPQREFSTAEKDITSCAIRKHSHSMIPSKVMAGMKIIKGGMKETVAKIPRIPKAFAISHQNDFPCTIRDTSSVSKKSGKSDLQKRYH